MSGPLITLTTDFGPSSVYVGQLKGRLLRDLPDARLVDLTHDLPPQDVAAAGRHLAECAPWFPSETIHLAVVDPGVGTARALLLARCGGAYYLAPDNGLLGRTLARQPPEFVRELDVERVATGAVAATFHGRDVLAPAAIRVARGERLDGFSRPISTWVRLDDPPPTIDGARVRGRVEAIDAFGNVITNIRFEDVARVVGARPASAPLRARLGRHVVDRFVRTYGDAPPDSLVALVGSSDRLEIAVVCGDAARRTGARLGDEVLVEASD